MEKEEETTRELLLPNWQGSGSHGLTIAQRDDGVFVQEVMQNSPAARTGVVKEGDQIVGATIYFDNLQSGEVTQLLNTMGHHTVGLKLHRKGDRSPEPGQTWTHEVFSSRSSEVVLNTPQPSALECKDRNKQKEATSQAGAVSVSTPNAGERSGGDRKADDLHYDNDTLYTDGHACLGCGSHAWKDMARDPRGPAPLPPGPRNSSPSPLLSAL
uniref:AHNAK nucleoprotein n=1 Tax=Callithrix jacchus TaxID=9483 RepID=A0A2R8PM46_CALJA